MAFGVGLVSYVCNRPGLCPNSLTPCSYVVFCDLRELNYLHIRLASVYFQIQWFTKRS
jgi:hypothetical protein